MKDNWAKKKKIVSPDQKFEEETKQMGNKSQ